MSENQPTLWIVVGRPLSIALFPLMGITLIFVLFGIDSEFRNSLLQGCTESAVIATAIVSLCLIFPLLFAICVGRHLKKRWEHQILSPERKKKVDLYWIMLVLMMVGWILLSIR